MIVYLWRKRKRDKERRWNGYADEQSMANRIISFGDRTNSSRPWSMPQLNSIIVNSSRQYIDSEKCRNNIKSILRSVPYNKKREIKRADFSVGNEIGKGNFGNVYVGKIKNQDGKNTETTVAVKSISTVLSDKELRDALYEIKIMGDVNPHLNLVGMIGSCTSEAKLSGKIWLVLEFCEYGDLKNYLTINKAKILSKGEGGSFKRIDNRCLIKWAFDVAKGMEQLALKHIMHGDLAARNILLDKDPSNSGYPVAKVADFGLSKNLYDNIRYEKRSRTYVPWKWMALEYLREDYFTLESDVWSFAVLFWEILAFGKEPYGKQEYNEVLEQLENGYRLPCPQAVKDISTWSPEGCYQKISQVCFTDDTEKRATFSDIVEMIKKELTAEEMNHHTRMCEKYQFSMANDYMKLSEAKTKTASNYLKFS